MFYHGGGLTKGDGRNGGGGIGADAGQGLQFRHIARKRPQRRNLSGAFQQIAGAGIIAQPRPFCQNLRIRRGPKRLNRWPKRGEAVEVGDHRCDGGLLQHDFGKPDPVGIGRDV